MSSVPTQRFFADWLAHRATSTPSRTALLADGGSHTFAELDRAVSALARQLAAAGVSEGDRVATLLHNGSLAALLPHALPRLGATLVPLNIRLAASEVAWLLADAEPALLVADSRTLALATEARAATAHGRILLDTELRSMAATGQASLRLSHPAGHVLAILYTSGTTGRPKGAMLTMGNFWWSAIGSALNLGSRPDDRWLACLPLHHVGGLSILVRAVIHGFAVEVHDGFDAAAVNAAIDRHGVTIVSLVAVMLQRMLEARATAPWPATLRCVLLGGGPASRALLERATGQGLPVVQTYGLTETTSQVATLAPDDALRKQGSAGRALYPNELRIEAGALGDGAGEILVRGPVVMDGYAGRPADSARALTGGWLRTGDVGRLDDEGFLYVLDRRDDLIVSGGENVYPAEVEVVLAAHPLVAEVAVVGVPDEQWGQRVVAVVVPAAPHGSATLADDLREHCRAQLAGYKVPREVRLTTAPLPRTASGKLRRAALREGLASG